MTHFVVAGSSGLIGAALCRSLRQDGHALTRLVRRVPVSPGEVEWDPFAAPDPSLIDGADVIVNLAGAGLGDHRWTRRYKQVILYSRMETAAALARMAAAARPAVLVSASGIRYYGVDRGDEVLTEAAGSTPQGFLPMVSRRWEAATEPVSSAGVRVCHMRLGLVLSQDGGLLPPLLRVFRLGLGTCFGSGREFLSYVSLTDAVRAIRFIASRPGASGPYNIAAPDPIRGIQFTRTLTRMVGKPAVARMPLWVARLAVGEMAPEVLGSLRVVPARLTDSGFGFEHPSLAAALQDAMERPHNS